MELGIRKIGSDLFNHQDGSKSPFEIYEVVIGNKTYELHTGCKEPVFDWEIKTYIWTARGRFCDPKGKVHQDVKHFFWVAKAAGLVKETKDEGSA